MAPGDYNGKNYGGLHTGTGKYQKGGVYSTNGQRYERLSHRRFKEGLKIAYVGCHKDFKGTYGEIINKKNDTFRSSRSTIKVKLNDERITYFHKNSLRFV